MLREQNTIPYDKFNARSFKNSIKLGNEEQEKKNSVLTIVGDREVLGYFYMSDIYMVTMRQYLRETMLQVEK